MPKPTEHKTVQARLLAYAQEIGWTYVPRVEAEAWRGFDSEGATQEERSRSASLFFGDLLHARVCAFNPQYREAEGALVGEFQRLHTDIYGNRDLLQALRNRRTFFCEEERRELDLTVIDYADLDRPAEAWRNVYEVTEEFVVSNGRFTTREDVVFLINGVPVLFVECKNATKDEAIALGVDQIRRYHTETPESMVPQMLFTATEAIGFAYGVTWNTVRRNIFAWKAIPQENGFSNPLNRGQECPRPCGETPRGLENPRPCDSFEAKVKAFCAVPHVLRLLRDCIVFAEKDEELQKIVLRQHQVTAVDRTVARCLDPSRTRGLVWHTQGSGKTHTLMKSAELLFRAPEAEKPTVLLMIDRNELEDQMLRNLASVGLGNVAHADSIAELNRLLRTDYRGIIVTMIHKFRDMPAAINLRRNIYVLIDEAHRTTGGDLGTFLMAGLPHATFVGFTGTPVDKTAYGLGTFKVFGCEDDKGYLHKYSIAESIGDGTTLPLYYSLAANEMLVPHEIMEREFLALAEAEGVADIEELNRILDRAVNLKNFLKGRERVAQVAACVAEHYRANVEPMGYKAFLVAVDREACVFYKEALDKLLPPEYSEIVFTGNNSDQPHLKR